MAIKINKKFAISTFIVLAFLISNITVSAATWKYGALHQHTGYSSWYGYDGIPGGGDGCLTEPNLYGYTVPELKQQALNLNLKWLGFSDHSYCLDSGEFYKVWSDCEAAQDSSFTCMWGEER